MLQVIALEMIVLTVYRAFPDLLHMDERISRKFICCAYLAATFGYAYVAISTVSIQFVHVGILMQSEAQVCD